MRGYKSRLYPLTVEWFCDMIDVTKHTEEYFYEHQRL